MTLIINNQKIETKHPLSIYYVSGSVGLYSIDFSFSDDWEGFSKTAIFRNRYSSETFSVPLEEDSCEIPEEMLYVPNEFVVGVYGEKGSMRKPTTWSSPIIVEEGADET